jgi:hypothetical protein
MAKTLSFGGHPPEPMSIHGARKTMGCAVRVEGDSLVVATYGEWASRKEGGAHMKLVAVIPDGVEVEQRPFLQRLLREEVIRGWTEIACHPGYPSEDFTSAYSSISRPGLNVTVLRAGTWTFSPVRGLRAVLGFRLLT